MKTHILIMIVIAFLVSSCAQGIPVQETTVTSPVPTEVTLTEVPVTPEPTVTEQPSAQKEPPKAASVAPTTTPAGCVTLLTPSDGAELPALGKVTFLWEPAAQATSYALKIVLPFGGTVTFETQKTFHDQYVEAFPAGGEYQWQVIVRDRKQAELCSSALFTFSKPASPQPRPAEDEDKKKKR